MIRPFALARRLVDQATGRSRRTWARDGRAHVEYRGVAAEDAVTYAKHLREAVEAVPGVHAAHVNPHVHRLVVTHDPDAVGCPDIVAAVATVEDAFGVADDPFPPERPDHPADGEPLLREAVHLLGDAAGVVGTFYGRVRSLAPGRGPADLSWLSTLVANVPQLRDGVERTVGPRTADLALGVTNSVLRGVRLGLSGHVVDVTQHATRIRELLTVRRTWEQSADRLGEVGGVDTSEPPARPDRPTPAADGPLESYAATAWPVSLGGFVAGLLATDDVEAATAPLLDGIPKAARLGRSAFVSEVTRVMAQRGMFVLDRDALERLDRVDVVVVEQEVLDTGLDDDPLGRAASTLLRAIHRSPMRLAVVGDRDVLPTAIGEVVAPDDADQQVADWQANGEVVLAVGATGARTFPRADVRLGVQPHGYPPAWDADILAGDDLADVLLAVRACVAARRNSQQAVTLSVAGAGIGATTALGGLRRRTPRQVLRVVDAAALLAMGNGVRLGTSLADLPATLHRQETPWHELDVDEVFARLGSSPQGLTLEQWRQRWTPPVDPPGRLRRAGRAVAEELANPLTPVLAGSTGLSLATAQVTDASMIASVMGLNATIGGVQRYRADAAVADLTASGQHEVVVRRGGERRTVPAAELVPGDVVELSAGDTIPADCRVVDCRSLEVDESHLTGESLPVTKGMDPVRAQAVADRTCMVFEGTTVAAGDVAAVVVAVGDETESRRAVAWAGDVVVDTGVEARLDQLTRVTIPLALLSGAGISVSGLLRRVPTRDLVDASVGLAIAAVPEGLPMLASAAQRAAARRLSRHQVLVRDPRAIEALGRVDVLCADKTGTLTQGRIRLAVVSDGETHLPVDDGAERHDQVLLAARRATPIDPDRVLPHPTDQAVAVGTDELDVHRGNGNGSFTLVDDLPFEPGRAYHAVLAHTDDGPLLSVKGAPEEVLHRCRAWRRGDAVDALGDGTRASLERHAEDLAAQGLRVLAIAQRTFDGTEVSDDDVTALELVGFLGLRDPVRPAAAESVARLRAAGVDVVMITGDHPITARSIAAELGLDDGRLLTGPEVDELDDDELVAILPGVRTFARVTPHHKVRLVQAFQRAGRVVAMTGDGANDAPAIRLADAGIAVGEHATDAARETADVVVLDDRIEVIVDAIAEGRGLWGSVRDAVSVLVGGNLGEIAFTLAGTIVGRRPPLNARQLLLVNLLTDVAPAMALAVRPPRADVDQLLAEGPESSLGNELSQALVWRGAGVTAGATATFAACRLTGSLPRAQTAGLVALVGSQMGQTLVSSRGDLRVVATSLATMAVLGAAVQTPGVSGLVGCRPMGPVGWVTGAAGAAVGTAVGVVGPRVEDRLRGETATAWSGRLVERLTSLGPDVSGLFAGG